MFARVFNVFFVTFAMSTLMVNAAVLSSRGGPGPGSCNSGSIQCCNSVQSAGQSPLIPILSLIGLATGDINAQVGTNCSPISVLGLGGNSCSSQAVCCTDNHFNGLVNVGCTPLNIGGL